MIIHIERVVRAVLHTAQPNDLFRKAAKKDNHFALIVDCMGKAENDPTKDCLKESTTNRNACCEGTCCAFGMFPVG